MPSMEQKNMMIICNNNNSNSNDENGYEGVGIHSQVRRIKQEMEKINFLALKQPEARPALHEMARQRQRSRSPLGLAEKRQISVGN